MTVMFVISYFFPQENKSETTKNPNLDFKSWRFTPHLSIALCIVTIFIYVSLGTQSG